MRRNLGLLVLSVLSAAVMLLGLAGTALLVYSERFSASVLCTDPEDFACSGHYVYGVPNEVWSVGVVDVGVALLIVSIALRRRPSPAL